MVLRIWHHTRTKNKNNTAKNSHGFLKIYCFIIDRTYQMRYLNGNPSGAHPSLESTATRWSNHGIFADQSMFSLNLPQFQAPEGTSVTSHKHGTWFLTNVILWNLDFRPLFYYRQFILDQTKAHSVIFLFTEPLQYGHPRVVKYSDKFMHSIVLYLIST